MQQIHLLTGNPGKIAAANAIFNQYKIEVLPTDLDLPEIQASSSQEVATFMIKEAYKQLQKPVIREDHSFFIDDLGMPGPYMNYIDKQITVEQLLKILDTLPSRNGHFELAAAYADGNGDIHEFSYQVPIEFAHEAKGDPNLRWERIIKFKDDSRVFAEYPESERALVWAKNYEQIAKLIAA